MADFPRQYPLPNTQARYANELKPLPSVGISVKEEQFSQDMIPLDQIVSEFHQVDKKALEAEIDHAIKVKQYYLVKDSEREGFEKALKSGLSWTTGLALDDATRGQLLYASCVAVVSTTMGYVLVPIITNTWVALGITAILPGLALSTKGFIVVGIILTPSSLVRKVLSAESISHALYWTGVGVYCSIANACELVGRQCHQVKDESEERERELAQG